MKFVLAPLVLLALVGCGGLDSYVSRHTGPNDGPARGTFTMVSPYVLAPGGTAVARVVRQGYGESVTYALAVQEGAAGGTLSPLADPASTNGLSETYTAPATPGTYHVVGTATEKNGKVHTETAVVTVQAAAQG